MGSLHDPAVEPVETPFRATPTPLLVSTRRTLRRRVSEPDCPAELRQTLAELLTWSDVEMAARLETLVSVDDQSCFGEALITVARDCGIEPCGSPPAPAVQQATRPGPKAPRVFEYRAGRMVER